MKQARKPSFFRPAPLDPAVAEEKAKAGAWVLLVLPFFRFCLALAMGPGQPLYIPDVNGRHVLGETAYHMQWLRIIPTLLGIGVMLWPGMSWVKRLNLISSLWVLNMMIESASRVTSAYIQGYPLDRFQLGLTVFMASGLLWIVWTMFREDRQAQQHIKEAQPTV